MLGELDPAQIEAVLSSEAVGRIGCHDAGRPYVVPITYAYDGSAVYCHSVEGQKLHMMRVNPFVCFEVEQIDDLANWRSVIAFGTFKELDGEAAHDALQRLVDRFAPLVPSATAHPGAGGPHPGGSTQGRPEQGRQIPVFFSINLLEKTGRFEKR